jgi:hypothetical protein
VKKPRCPLCFVLLPTGIHPGSYTCDDSCPVLQRAALGRAGGCFLLDKTGFGHSQRDTLMLVCGGGEGFRAAYGGLLDLSAQSEREAS